MVEMVEVMQTVLHVVRCILSCDHLEIDTLWDPLILRGTYLTFCSEATLSFFVNHPFPCVHLLDCGTNRPQWTSLEPRGSVQMSYYNLALDLTPPKAKGSGSQGFTSWFCLLLGV